MGGRDGIPGAIEGGYQPSAISHQPSAKTKRDASSQKRPVWLSAAGCRLYFTFPGGNVYRSRAVARSATDSSFTRTFGVMMLAVSAV